MSHLPPATDDVARLVDLIGEEAALRLIEARGGTRVYCADPDEDRSLTGIVGLDAAAKMRAKYGANRVKVPVGRQWRVLCYKAMGLPHAKIARRAGCSETTVGDILRRYGRPAPAQLDFFS